MKKVIGVILLTMCCLMATMPAQAQFFGWGVKGGLNLSKLDSSFEGVKDNTTGFFIGPMVEATIPIIGLGLDASLLYSQRGEGEYKQQGVDIPINLKYTIGLGSMLGVFIAAGPDFYFNFKNTEFTRSKTSSPISSTITTDEYESKKKLVSLNVGAGLKLFRHLQLGVNYNIPLGDSFKLKNAGDVDSKYRTWQVSLAYLF